MGKPEKILIGLLIGLVVGWAVWHRYLKPEEALPEQPSVTAPEAAPAPDAPAAKAEFVADPNVATLVACVQDKANQKRLHHFKDLGDGSVQGRLTTRGLNYRFFCSEAVANKALTFSFWTDSYTVSVGADGIVKFGMLKAGQNDEQSKVFDQDTGEGESNKKDWQQKADAAVSDLLHFFGKEVLITSRDI